MTVFTVEQNAAMYSVEYSWSLHNTSQLLQCSKDFTLHYLTQAVPVNSCIGIDVHWHLGVWW